MDFRLQRARFGCGKCRERLRSLAQYITVSYLMIFPGSAAAVKYHRNDHSWHTFYFATRAIASIDDTQLQGDWPDTYPVLGHGGNYSDDPTPKALS